MISRETERFVNELHQLKREFRSSNELLLRRVQRRKGVRYEERKVTTSHKEIWAAPSSWKQDADPIILTQNQEHLCTKWAIPRKWEKVDNDSCKLSSLESLGDNDFETSYVNVSSLWSWKECQEKSLHRMEREISVMTSCHNRFSKAAQWTESNIAKTKMESYMLFTSYSRTLGRYRSRSKFNGIFSNFSALEEALVSKRTFMDLSICIGIWMDSGRKGER